MSSLSAKIIFLLCVIAFGIINPHHFDYLDLGLNEYMILIGWGVGFIIFSTIIGQIIQYIGRSVSKGSKKKATKIVDVDEKSEIYLR